MGVFAFSAKEPIVDNFECFILVCMEACGQEIAVPKQPHDPLEDLRASVENINGVWVDSFAATHSAERHAFVEKLYTEIMAEPFTQITVFVYYGLVARRLLSQLSKKTFSIAPAVSARVVKHNIAQCIWLDFGNDDIRKVTIRCGLITRSYRGFDSKRIFVEEKPCFLRAFL